MLKNGSINLILYINKYYIHTGHLENSFRIPHFLIPPIPTSPEQMPSAGYFFIHYFLDLSQPFS